MWCRWAGEHIDLQIDWTSLVRKGLFCDRWGDVRVSTEGRSGIQWFTDFREELLWAPHPTGTGPYYPQSGASGNA